MYLRKEEAEARPLIQEEAVGPSCQAEEEGQGDRGEVVVPFLLEEVAGEGRQEGAEVLSRLGVVGAVGGPLCRQGVEAEADRQEVVEVEVDRQEVAGGEGHQEGEVGEEDRH